MEERPRTSFKYRSGPAALRCLSEGSAYFASPAELNDSLEAKFDLPGASNFVDAVMKALDELARQRGYEARHAFDEAAAEEFGQTHALENNLFYDATQKVGIFSTAARPDNQPMWAYHCDNSKGVCFELEWPDEILKRHQLWPTKVCYSKDARVHNRADDLRDLLLELGAKHPDWTIPQIQEFALAEPFRRAWGVRSIGRAVSTKHSDWQHEGELRMVAPRSGPVPLMKEILKRVFFVRTDFPEWGSLMMLLHRLYPDVKLAQVSFEHTEPFVRVKSLEFTTIPAFSSEGEGSP